MKRFIQLAVISAMVVLYSCGGNKQSQNNPNDSLKTGTTAPDSTKTGTHYVCPMHPDQKSDKPGKCGVCGMDLEVQS